MKKQIIFVFLYTIFLLIPFASTNVSAKDNTIHYEIRMDKKSDSAQSKEQVISIIAYLCDQVDSESYHDMIQDNLSYFERINHWDAQWKEDTLIITINNKKTKKIKGTYEENQVCFEQVQPKSIVLEWLEG